MDVQHKLTAKAQVTIPKDVRAELGVKPGDMVRFVSDADGRVTLLKGDESVTSDARQQRMRLALNRLRGKYPNPDRMSTDEYMQVIRGDWEP